MQFSPSSCYFLFRRTKYSHHFVLSHPQSVFSFRVRDQVSKFNANLNKQLNFLLQCTYKNSKDHGDITVTVPVLLFDHSNLDVDISVLV